MTTKGDPQGSELWARITQRLRRVGKRRPDLAAATVQVTRGDADEADADEAFEPPSFIDLRDKVEDSELTRSLVEEAAPLGEPIEYIGSRTTEDPQDFLGLPLDQQALEEFEQGMNLVNRAESQASESAHQISIL
jgi:hypothetical protein